MGPVFVLVLDDVVERATRLTRSLRADGRFVQYARSCSEASGIMRDPRLAVAVVSASVQAAGECHVLEQFKRERPDVAVLAMSRSRTLERALTCLRSGAFDFLVNPVDDPGELRDAVRRALDARASLAARLVALAPGRPAEAHVPLSLDAYEKLALERALAESLGDATAAARRLGIGRSTFYRKAAKHGLVLSGPETPRRSPFGAERGAPRPRGVGPAGSIG